MSDEAFDPLQSQGSSAAAIPPGLLLVRGVQVGETRIAAFGAVPS